jgi:hypothetical protein
MGAVDLRSRHFAFRGAKLSLLALSRCGVSTFPLFPAGVCVPCTPINRVFINFWANFSLKNAEFFEVSLFCYGDCTYENTASNRRLCFLVFYSIPPLQRHGPGGWRRRLRWRRRCHRGRCGICRRIYRLNLSGCRASVYRYIHSW